MRAAVLKEFRKPFSIEEINVEPKEDEVIVNIKAVGVCGRDLVVWKGGFRNLKTPLVLGHEIFGEFNGKPVAVFPAKVGKECLKLSEGKENLCNDYSIIGEKEMGGYSEAIAIPKWNLIDLPDKDYEKYAASTCGVATIIHANNLAKLDKGSKVLVTGANGGVGIHAIQYLSNLYEVYAYVRSEEKAKQLKDLNVTPVTSFDFYKKFGKVDGVFEIVGSLTINESMLSLKKEGKLILIGNISGEPINLIRPAFIVMNEISIIGSAAYTKKEYEEAIKIISEGKVKPFYKAYNLSDINNAYNDIINGKIVGRAVLRI
ncbi:alcohol dehydrogenase catalytic domain-containing protein [Caldisphaera lagunensis]|uniref:alcohol dehydrogenase catalytic domain-containing protein n=1 Tax=Caldisphaera lagunensis TaxID=200415 RepID=UPI0012F7A53B